MKFTLTFKSPDVFDELKYIADNEYDTFPQNSSDKEELIEEMKEFACEYVTYSEYVSIEFDTETKTATVLKNNK